MSDDNQEYNIRTHCFKCVFKESDGTKQTGCFLKKLDKFKELNTRVEWDEDNQSYIIYRFCSCCRDENWSKKIVDTDLASAIKKETQLKYGFVLVDSSSSPYNETYDNLVRMLENINSMTLKPKSVMFSTSNTNFIKNIKKASTIFDKYPNLKIVTVLEDDASHYRCADVALKKMSGISFYSSYDINQKNIPTNMLTKVDSLINDDLKQFILIEPNDDYPMVVNFAIHTSERGNDGGYIEDKIHYKAVESNMTNLIIKWDEIK